MSTVTASLRARPVTLEQLAALSDEIGALVRAGVPLDQGLCELSRDMPGRLGQVAGEISQSLAAGKPLEQTIAELGAALPPAYRAVIVAGVRAGRLPLAMEGISHTARRITQLRSTIYLSLLYPLMVLLVAWSLGVFIMVKVGPVLSQMMVEFDVAGPWIVRAYELGRIHARWAGAILPLLFAAWIAWGWFQSGQIAQGRELHPLVSFGGIGVLARLQRASRLASLADMLALLISNSVPLAEAVELASGAVGSKSLVKGGQEVANALKRGEPLAQVPAGFPPLLAWMLAGGQSQPQLVRTLSRAAEIYREEVAWRTNWLIVYVPLFATIGVCGVLVFLYAVITLGPWIALMYRVSLPG